MIDYDSFSHCHLTDIFAGAKELNKRLESFNYPQFLSNKATGI